MFRTPNTANRHDAVDENAQPTKSTSPLIWSLSTLSLLVLLVLRSQQLHTDVAAKVRDAAADSAINDPAVTSLAVDIGFYLGVVLSTMLAALYFSMASVAESRIFPGVRIGRGRARMGFLGMASIASLLGIQVFSLAFSLPSPKESFGAFVYVGIIGLASPLLFHRAWRGGRRTSVTAIFLSSIATAALSLAL